MLTVVSKYLVPKGYAALTIFPVVFLADRIYRKDAVLLNHEKIHLRQQAELLLVFFFVWYGIEYMLRRFRFKSHRQAYRAISFETEAYANERNFGYLTRRPLWNFRRYLK